MTDVVELYADDMTLEEALQHYGVPGMRWGRRRSAKALAAAAQTRKEKKNARDASKGGNRVEKKNTLGAREKTQYKTGPKKLSTEVLQTRIKRLEAEKRYSDLNNKTTDKGKSVVKQILGNAGKQSAQKLTDNALNYAIRVTINKQFGDDVGSQLMPYKKNIKLPSLSGNNSSNDDDD